MESCGKATARRLRPLSLTVLSQNIHTLDPEWPRACSSSRYLIFDDVRKFRRQLDNSIPNINISSHIAVKTMKSDEKDFIYKMQDKLLFRNEGKVEFSITTHPCKANCFGRLLGA